VKPGVGVRFTGWLQQDEVAERFATPTSLLHRASPLPIGDQEGLPTAIIEAVASGMPMISTWHSGIPELLGKLPLGQQHSLRHQLKDFSSRDFLSESG
jgi:glycosyltransferase involved in cell wall biosynthesis